MMDDPNSLTLTVITEAEDEDSPTFLDLRDNKCESNKTPAAIKQFNFFLKGYCDSKGYNNRVGFDPISTVEQIPYKGLEGIHGDHDEERWWSDLIGNFFNYLAFDAYKHCKKENGLLMYDSATGYASAIKSLFLNRFRDKQPRLVFSDSSWRKLRDLLLTKCKERGRRTGQRISSPKTASNDGDRKAMANACFWLGTIDAAEFHGLNVSVFHLCGRGREVSILKPVDVSVVYVSEGLQNFDLLSVSLQRDKDGPLQELSLYPHRESLCEDPYFALIYSLLVGGCGPDLFPKFSREASILRGHEKSISRVAAHWKICFNSLHKEFKSLSETLNTQLTSYHGRKGANQKLAETNRVNGFAGAFRTGWELRGIHTIFDYVVGSKTLINQAGKTLSGWTSEIGGGGVPPKLSSIRSSPELVNDFVLALFGDDIEQRWPASIRNILTATLLRYYEDFLLVIEQHPKELYEDNSRHPMVHSINKALRLAKVDQETLSLWCKEVHEGFCTNNYMALPIECLSPDAARITKIDPRSLYDRFNQLCNSYNGLFAQKMNLEDDVSRLRLDVASLTRSNHRLEKAVTNQTEILVRVANVLEIKFDKQDDKAIPSPPMEDVMLFSDSMKRWRKDFSVKEQFVRYFVDQCHRGYELEKNSAGFKNKLRSEREKIKNQYKRLKKTIKTMLFFCDSFPKPAPQNSSSLVTWQRELSALAEHATNALQDALPDLNSPIRITQAYLMKSEIVKNWDNPDSPLAKNPPKDTPDIILAHFGFNSNVQ